MERIGPDWPLCIEKANGVSHARPMHTLNVTHTCITITHDIRRTGAGRCSRPHFRFFLHVGTSDIVNLHKNEWIVRAANQRSNHLSKKVSSTSTTTMTVTTVMKRKKNSRHHSAQPILRFNSCEIQTNCVPLHLKKKWRAQSGSVCTSDNKNVYCKCANWYAKRYSSEILLLVDSLSLFFSPDSSYSQFTMKISTFLTKQRNIEIFFDAFIKNQNIKLKYWTKAPSIDSFLQLILRTMIKQFHCRGSGTAGAVTTAAN